jgi:hypothetical protein
VQPKEEPTVALLVAGARAADLDGPAIRQLRLWYESASDPSHHTTEQEVVGRVRRDRERLLRNVARVETLVPLPLFDERDPFGSLDRAAAELIARAVAK